MTHHQLVKIADLQTKIGCCLCCGQEWVLNFLHITKFAFNFLFYDIPDCGFQTAEFEWFSTANFAIFSGGHKLTLCVFSETKQKRYTADNKQYNAFVNCGCVVNVCFCVVALMPLSSQDGFYCPIELLVGFRATSFIHVVVV